MRPGVVFIAEEEDSSFTGAGFDRFLTGRFEGHLEQGDRVAGSFEDLALEEALAWARERADEIVLRVGYEDVYAIGFEPGDDVDARPWPEGGIEAPVRRRTPDEAWKDRTDADPDARWEATIALTPPPPPEGFMEERREPGWDAVVEAVAGELGAAWSAENIDGWMAEMRAAARRARRSPTGEAGWATSFTRAYAVTFGVLAPTAARAREAAAARLPELPPGWSARASVAFEGE